MPKKTKQSIYDFYIEKSNELQSTYGGKTVVLMLVGSFFEIYGYKNTETGDIWGSPIVEISEITGFTIANKSGDSGIDNTRMVMAGFPEYKLDHFLSILDRAGYTVAVYTQKEQTKNTTRELAYITSPGTYFNDTDTTVISNNITCVWIEHVPPTRINKKARVVVGISTIDILSGTSNYNQFINEYYHKPNDFDDLERYISIYHPKEIVFVYNDRTLSLEKLDDIINFTTTHVSTIRKINLSNNEHELSIMATNCDKQKYQYDTFDTFFNPPDIYTFMEEHGFNEEYCASSSYAFLLNYAKSLNSTIVDKLLAPSKEYKLNRMVVGNHTLKQLNVIDTSYGSGKYSSVLKFLNKCYTNAGKREFEYQLLHPSLDTSWLNQQYSMVDVFIQFIENTSHDNVTTLRSCLTNSCDLSRFYRKIVINKLKYSDLCGLYDTLGYITQVLYIFQHNDDVMSYLGDVFKTTTPFDTIMEQINELQHIFDIYVDVEKCKLFSIDNIDNCNFIKRGICDTLDKAEELYVNSMDIMTSVVEKFNEIYNTHKTTTRGSSTPCKLNKTEKTGYYIDISKTHAKTIVNNIPENYKILYKSTYRDTYKEFCITDNVKTVTGTKSRLKVSNRQIDTLTFNNLRYKNDLQQEINDAFTIVTGLFREKEEVFQALGDFMKYIDVFLLKARLSHDFNYCRPTINTERQDESYIIGRDLRHVLIEHIQTQELYVPNDVTIGVQNLSELEEERVETYDSMLLFGTNAVGKSSYIKSVGIALIMAQAGMYVPCSSFEYSPFDSIYTRIIGNDNIFKGLSTFAVEMLELNNILRYSNDKTLVLGDELCSGTELGSAISIFVAGLQYLAKKQTKSIFATHFHEIVKLDEIMSIDTLVSKHMSVEYDAVTGALVYNRTIQDGPGSNSYGLEVCKSLNLPVEFLDMAQTIRYKLHDEEKTAGMRGVSRYNSKKIVGNCEMCGSKGVDVHHMQYQEDADERGFIGSFHKNHKANLMNLCKKCHNKTHSENTKYVRRKTTAGKKIVAV